MKEGEDVRVRGNKKIGKIHRISNKKVEVMWIMGSGSGSGWKHIVEYEADELEGV